MCGDWATMACNDSVSHYFLPLISIKVGASWFWEAIVKGGLCKVLIGAIAISLILKQGSQYLYLRVLI